MKRTINNIPRIHTLITIILIFSLPFNSLAQRSKTDLNYDPYSKAINHIIKNENGKYTYQEILNMLANPNPIIHEPTFLADDPTFSISPSVYFAEFYDDGEAVFNYSAIESNGYNLITITCDSTQGGNWIDKATVPDPLILNGTINIDINSENPDQEARLAIFETEAIFNNNSSDFTVSKTIYVVQGPAPFGNYLLISPEAQAIPYDGGEFTFEIFYNGSNDLETDDLPTWLAATNVTINDDNDLLTINFTQNDGDSYQYGTITVQEVGGAGLTNELYIVQGAFSQSSILVSPEIQSFSYKEQTTNKFNIIHLNITDWEVGSNLPDWITINPDSSHSGNDYVKFDLARNTRDKVRDTIIIIQDTANPNVADTLTIYQGAESPVPIIIIEPEVQVLDYHTQTTNKFNIIHFNITDWEVGSNLPDWITINPDSSHSGNDYVKFDLARNTRDKVRDTIIIIQDTANPNVADTLTIYQGTQSGSSILVTPEVLVVDFEAHPTSDQVKIIYFNIDGWEVNDSSLPYFLDDNNPYTISYPDSTITFNIERNYEDTYREGYVTIQETNDSTIFDRIKIIQGAEAESVILATPEKLVIDYKTQTTKPVEVIRFNINGFEVDENRLPEFLNGTNPYTISAPDSLISFHVENNSGDTYRMDTIFIQEVGGNGPVGNILIYQGALAESVILATPETIVIDYKQQTTQVIEVIHFNVNGWEVDEDRLAYFLDDTNPYTITQDSTITFHVKLNQEDTYRMDTIFIQEVGGNGPVDTILIYQGALAVSSLIVSPQVLAVSHEGADTSEPFTVIHFNLEANPDDGSQWEWEWVDDDDDAWIPEGFLSENDDGFDEIRFKILENNTDDYRDGKIRISALENDSIADTIYIVQGAYARPSLLVYPKVQTVGHKDASPTYEFYVVYFNSVVDWDNITWTTVDPDDMNDISIESYDPGTSELGWVRFNVEDNPKYEPREWEITIIGLGPSPDEVEVFDNFRIVQDAKPNPYLIASPRVQSVGHNGLPLLTFDVKSGNLNGLWTVDTVHYIPDPDDEWISSGNMPQALLTITAAENHNKYTRKAEIHIHANEGEVKDTVTVFQYADTSSYILTAPREQVIPWDYKKDSLPESLPQPFIITSVNVDEVKFEIIDPPAPEDHWLFPSEGSIDGDALQLEVLNINEEQETRIARIRIYDAGNTNAEDTVVVYQRSSIEPYIILVPASKVDVDSAGQTFIIQTFSNLQNNHLIPDSIELYQSDPTTILSGDTMISITVMRNSSSFSQRSSFITFKNDEDEVEEVFYWQQNKQSEIPITVSGSITAADQGVNQVTVDAGDSTALTNSEGYYELNLKKGWFGSIVPKNGTHYFDPSEITYTVNDPLSIDTEGIDFDAYIINPAVSLAFDSTAICGVNQLDSSMVEYPTPTVTGTYGQEEYRWTTDPFYQHTIIGDSLLYPTFMPDDTITYTYVLTLYNNADSAKASFDLKVKPRPKAREIKGDFSVCKNQSGQVYTVLERSADEYFVWGFPNGGGSFNDKSDFHSNIVLVNWDKEPGEDISLSLITLKDGCSSNDTIIQPITFTGNSSSPNNTRVFQKSGEDFLYCDDEDASKYRWGWFEIEDGTSEISAPDYFSDRNQWYCRLPDGYPANSKSIHYFVETKHKEEDCYSRFFLNDDIPVGLNENSFGLIEIFPNPTDYAINIRFNTVELNGDVEISIYDLAGNKVYNETFERLRNNSVISIEDTQYFNRGLYVVQILYGKRSFQSKIIVR